MKKKIVICGAILFGLLAGGWGNPELALAFPGYDTGISSQGQYQELVFVSGQPQVFVGTIKDSTRAKGDQIQTTLTYKLEDAEGNGDKLTRTVKLTSKIEKRGKQEVYISSLDSYTESVTVGGQQYKVGKEAVFFSGSEVVDCQPMIDYSNGNWNLKKTYEAGRNMGRVIVEMNGQTDYYANAWGEGDSAQVQISVEGETVSTQGEKTTSAWQGSARVVMNRTMARSLNYMATDPELISFSGGFIDEIREEQVLKATYNLPLVGDEGLLDNRRDKGELTLTGASLPQSKRLFVKECKDLRGHWARAAIESLCGLGAFEVTGNYFLPGVAMKRGEYIKAVMVVGERAESTETQTNSTAKRRNEPVEEPIFLDVEADHPLFKYIQSASKMDIVRGNGAVFNPYDNLTRAEAIAIMVKAMGLENLAPTPSYTTGYYDDAAIPLWAKDAVYVATNYGLIKGDLIGGNRLFRPLDIVTRAEAASMIDQFRVYLNQDFSQDRQRVYQIAR
ncbi:MAG: S-layer homology domain-containing protein [Syntrophomonadaceae bacterium]|nr:S-layer homology domain-containing protein [Syntrophomonadaceae bacterium]